MSKGMHRTSCLPNLAKSHLSGIELAAHNSHFLVLPLSHSLSGWLWHTFLLIPHNHTEGTLFVGVIKKVTFSGGFMSIASAGFS